ncbi:MAG: hypothetical protein ACRD68_14755, partial [Pyrinomonadaceae bacterium]
IDRTPGNPGGLAVKLGEKARVAPDKLLALVGARGGASFAPSGVLRIELDAAEADAVIETAHRLLLEIRSPE